MSDLLGPIMPWLDLAGKLGLVFYAVFVGALVFWIWRDARRRGAMSLFWAIAAIPFSVFTWMIYLIVRPPETLDDVHERETEIAAREAELQMNGATCPNCLRPVERDFLICPTCLKKLKKPCEACDRPIKLTWSVCPYCKSKQSPSESAANVPQPEKAAWTADPLAASSPDSLAGALAKTEARAKAASVPESIFPVAIADPEPAVDEVQ